MGKGDKKTRRGKITQGSYGKTRQKKSSKLVVANEKPAKIKAEKAEPKTAPKPKAKKVVTEEKETKPKSTKTKKTEE